MNHARYKGSVTVFLSLIMFVLIAFVSGLVEVVKVHNMKVNKRVVSEGAIESVFAEFHSGLRKTYGIFGLDGAYESGVYSQEKILERFTFYGGNGDDVEVETLQLMTDNKGAGFLDQVMLYMTQTTGLSFVEGLLNLTPQWEDLEIEENENGENGLAQLEDIQGAVDPEEENPLSGFFDFDIQGILNFVVENKESLSEQEVTLDKLVSHRNLNTGIGTSVSLDYGKVTQKLALDEYVLNQLANAGDTLKSSPIEEAELNEEENTREEDRIGLQYQVEYIIAGKASDQENLKAVVHKLLLIRTPINYACVKADGVKSAEVNALAITLAAVTGSFATKEIISEALFWAWSYAESMADVRALLSGKYLTLVKTSEQWQLDISSLLNFGNESIESVGEESGMDYKDFLRILLYLEELDEVTMRTMDMVELGVQSLESVDAFYMDKCVSRLRFSAFVNVGLNYTYEFPLEYGYR